MFIVYIAFKTTIVRAVLGSILLGIDLDWLVGWFKIDESTGELMPHFLFLVCPAPKVALPVYLFDYVAANL